AYDVDQLLGVGRQLRDRELADRDDQPGLQDPHLVLEMPAAALDLLVARDAIAAAFLGLAREAATDPGHVDAMAELLLGQAERLEPREHRPAGRPRERLAGRSFTDARSLTDQHHR